MGFFLDENEGTGELAALASPAICESTNSNMIIRKEDILTIKVKLADTERQIYVDINLLKKYGISTSISCIEVDETDENIMSFLYELKPIRPSDLKKILM